MKKILNIFASISLITSGTSSVVACGSHHKINPPKPTPPKPDDQKIVNDIANKINNKTIIVQQKIKYKKLAIDKKAKVIRNKDHLGINQEIMFAFEVLV